MKTNLLFYDNQSRDLAPCGDPLVIEKSSRQLGWKGVLLEKGWSPFFYPTDIVTPYFYFALALEKDLHWHVENDGRLKELKTEPGEIWINPPWTPFTHKIDEACFFIIFAVEEHLMFESFAGPLPEGELQFLNNYNLADDYLKNLIELFYFEVESGGANGMRFVTDLLKVFCRYFIEHYSNIQSVQSRTPPSRISAEQVKTVEAYILENIAESIRIDELAAEVNMSKFYFLKEFKKATGKTPYQYLTDLRMERAAEYIHSNGMDLATIAIQLGFSDQSHFSRVFKRHFNVSPGNYRKQTAPEQ